MTANGIDLFYDYQAVTDPQAIAQSGVQFAYCKISDGHPGNVDENAAAQQGDALQGAGIAVGYYHYAQPGLPAAAQAQAFAAILGRRPHDLIPMVDVEQTASGVDYGAWTKAFIDAYRAASGRRRILVYSSLSWFTGQLPPAAFVDANDRDVLLWAARYRIPANPNGLGWSHPDLELYQWSDSGSVPGISSQVDLDVDLAPLSELMEDNMPLTPDDADLAARRTLDFPLDDAGTTLSKFVQEQGSAKPIANQVLDLDLSGKNDGNTLSLIAQEVKAALPTLLAAAKNTQAPQLDAAAVAQQLAQLEGPQIVAAFEAALPQLPAELLSALRTVLDKAGA